MTVCKTYDLDGKVCGATDHWGPMHNIFLVLQRRMPVIRAMQWHRAKWAAYLARHTEDSVSSQNRDDVHFMQHT